VFFYRFSCIKATNILVCTV